MNIEEKIRFKKTQVLFLKVSVFALTYTFLYNRVTTDNSAVMITFSEAQLCPLTLVQVAQLHQTRLPYTKKNKITRNQSYDGTVENCHHVARKKTRARY